MVNFLRIWITKSTISQNIKNAEIRIYLQVLEQCVSLLIKKLNVAIFEKWGGEGVCRSLTRISPDKVLKIYHNGILMQVYFSRPFFPWPKWNIVSTRPHHDLLSRNGNRYICLPELDKTPKFIRRHSSLVFSCRKIQNSITKLCKYVSKFLPNESHIHEYGIYRSMLKD